jgi:hypothetical protein
MATTSAAAQIASSVKSSIEGYTTIRSVKLLTMKLCNQFKTETKEALTQFIALLLLRKEMTAMMTAMAASNKGGGGTCGSKGKGCSKQDYKNMCKKKAMYKPEDCFSLPANADKIKKANFVDGKAVKKEYSPVSTRNYYDPLDSWSDTLETAFSIRKDAPASKRGRKHVRFVLPSNHIDKDSRIWRRKATSKSPESLRMGVLSGSVPSAISDTGALASAIKPSDPTIATGIKSNTSFGGAFGELAVATTVNKLYHQLREPARSEHIMPQVKDSLFSTGKCVDADYIAIYDKLEVKYYDAKTTKITVSNEAVLTGWRFPKHPTNVNVDTLLLDHPTKLENLNSLYEV